MVCYALILVIDYGTKEPSK